MSVGGVSDVIDLDKKPCWRICWYSWIATLQPKSVDVCIVYMCIVYVCIVYE